MNFDEFDRGRRWIESTFREEGEKLGITPLLQWGTAALGNVEGRIPVTVMHGEKSEAVALKQGEFVGCPSDSTIQSALRFRIRTILQDLAGTLESHED